MLLLVVDKFRGSSCITLHLLPAGVSLTSGNYNSAQLKVLLKHLQHLLVLLS